VLHPTKIPAAAMTAKRIWVILCSLHGDHILFLQDGKSTILYSRILAL